MTKDSRVEWGLRIVSGRPQDAPLQYWDNFGETIIPRVEEAATAINAKQ